MCLLSSVYIIDSQHVACNDSFISLQKSSISRNVSYKKEYGEASDFVMESISIKGGGTGNAIGASMDIMRDAGLLNVLDGVVDTLDRMLVMATNHPEMLDPALIIPGRIDKKLLLGYLRCTDLVAMLEHYFQTKVN